MAESSRSTMITTGNSYYSNGTLISHLTSDHIFSILLLLPIDSVLSFAMTCKRFKSLSCSNNLWESICRRDFGSSTFDALKFSIEAKLHDHHQQQQKLPWMKLYKQVYQIDTVSCHRLSDLDGELVHLGPRASHSLNFVSDCLVLFGGGSEGGRHLDDTWVAYNATNFHTPLKWQMISSGIPSGRFGHTCVVIQDSLILFGGINDLGIRQNDTWVGQITHHETRGISLSWRLLDAGPTKPPARGAHAACCIDNTLIIHGGIGLYALRLADTWALDLSDNHCSGTWRQIVNQPCPPARSGHTLTCVGGTKIVLFGGRSVGYEVLGDIWIFNTTDKKSNWVQIIYDLKNTAEGASLPRVGHSATLILGGRVLIYGGEDSSRNRKDDLWVLDVNKSKGSLKCTWRRLKSKGYVPKGRSFHCACADRSRRYLYISGGMVDGIVQPGDVAELRFDGDIFLVELLLQL